jgi:glycine reductase
LVDLKGKRVIVIGERDGIQGPVIADAVERLGASVVYNITQCFV